MATESFTEASAFEGLFVRALKPQGAFADELRAAGYDPANPQLRYPSRVWSACLEIARRHTFPDLPQEEGLRRLGYVFMDGYFQTLLGRMAGVALPLIGPDVALQRAPRNWAMVNPQARLEVKKEGERHYTATLHERGALPDFCAGLLETSGRRTKADVTVRVVERHPDYCVFDLRW